MRTSSTSRRRVQAQRARRVGDRRVRTWPRSGSAPAADRDPVAPPRRDAEVDQGAHLRRRLTRFVTVHPGWPPSPEQLDLHRHLLAASPLTGGALTASSCPGRPGFFGAGFGAADHWARGHRGCEPGPRAARPCQRARLRQPTAAPEAAPARPPGAAGSVAIGGSDRSPVSPCPPRSRASPTPSRRCCRGPCPPGGSPPWCSWPGSPGSFGSDGFETSLRGRPRPMDGRRRSGAGRPGVLLYPALLAAVVVAGASALAAEYGPCLLRSVGMAAGALAPRSGADLPLRLGTGPGRARSPTQQASLRSPPWSGLSPALARPVGLRALPPGGRRPCLGGGEPATSDRGAMHRPSPWPIYLGLGPRPPGTLPAGTSTPLPTSDGRGGDGRTGRAWDWPPPSGVSTADTASRGRHLCRSSSGPAWPPRPFRPHAEPGRSATPAGPPPAPDRARRWTARTACVAGGGRRRPVPRPEGRRRSGSTAFRPKGSVSRVRGGLRSDTGLPPVSGIDALRLHGRGYIGGGGTDAVVVLLPTVGIRREAGRATSLGQD